MSYQELDSYFRLLGITPQEWEVKLIKALDTKALKQFSKDSTKNNKKK